MGLVSGLANPILELRIGTVTLIMAALPGTTILGASGGSAAIEIAIIASTAKAVRSVNLTRVVGIRACVAIALREGSTFVVECEDWLRLVMA
jgi:hypothetical protein